MSKTFRTVGSGSTQTLEKIENNKIPVYETKAAAEADIANLTDGQLIATKDEGNEMFNPVDVVESGNLHAVTSNAVFDYVNNVEEITPTINTDSRYEVVEIKVIKTGNVVSIAGIITINSQIETVTVATGLPVPLITKLTNNNSFFYFPGQRGTNNAGQAIRVDNNGNLIVYTNDSGGNYYFSGTYITE